MRRDPDWLTAPLNPGSGSDDFWVPWQIERLARHADIDREIDDEPRVAARRCRHNRCRRARTCQMAKTCKDEAMRWYFADLAKEAEAAAAEAAERRKAARPRSRPRRNGA
jgi:hypothetical protein